MAKKNILSTLSALDFIQQGSAGATLPCPIIETHCHLDYLKNIGLDNLINTTTQLGIEKIITISVAPNNFQAVIDLSSKYQNVYCTQGIHPHQAIDFNDDCLTTLKQNINSSKVVAIGEIGLDYYYNKSPIETQRKVFETHLQLAIDSDLPVVIHTRDADEDTISILKNFSQKLKRKGVLHSFTSGKALAEFAVSEGFSLGFNGIITFKNALNVVQVLELTPLENILLETDAPFLTPAPHRGEENNSLYLPLIADKIAQVKNIPPLQALKSCYQNTLRVFPKLA